MTTAVSLADAIANDKEALIQCWRTRVQDGIDPSSAPASEIINTLPPFLDEMAALLRDQAAAKRNWQTERAGAIALEHGAQRFHAGFSLGAVIREYGVLRECLLEHIHERGIAYTMDELQAVLAMLSAAVANAAEQFARERDEVIERENEQHFGFIAHELRNPLGSAVIALHLLQQRPGADRDIALLRLGRNLLTLRRRIDNSLVGLRIRHLGRTRSLQLARVDLRQVVEAAREDLAGDAEERRIAITVEGDAVTRADPKLIHSAIANLVGNAVKYTRPQGAIHVRMRGAPDLVTVEVEDECGGLPEGKVEELFTPFVQRSANRTGFGLGLAITKDAVDAHHGSIQVSNLPGKGCVFMISLPRTDPEPSAT